MAALTIPEAAKRAGVTPETMRRRLRKAGVEFAGTKKRFWVTHEQLEKVLPEYFGSDKSTAERVEELEAIVVDLQRRINALRAAQREFQQKAYEWFKKASPDVRGR